MANHPNRKFPALQRRALNELGLELFRDRIRLSGVDGPGIYKFHLRKNSHSAAWPHFKTLDDVSDYLDAAA